MRISEVAERSGFSSATLRYYEQVDRLRDLIMVKLGGAREQVVGLEVFTADLRRMLDNLDSELPGRVGEWRQLASHVVARSPIDGGTRLLLDAGAPLDELVLLMAAEQGCCSFFAFALIVDAPAVWRWRYGRRRRAGTSSMPCSPTLTSGPRRDGAAGPIGSLQIGVVDGGGRLARSGSVTWPGFLTRSRRPER